MSVITALATVERADPATRGGIRVFIPTDDTPMARYHAMMQRVAFCRQMRAVGVDYFTLFTDVRGPAVSWGMDATGQGKWTHAVRIPEVTPLLA